MNIPDTIFVGATRILDVGGWFKPDHRATHVVDLMPWETRGAKLNLERQSNEKFDKSTWCQIDFLKDGFRLPFEDGFFDFVICGHTIEDLSDPVGIILEMQRVGARGVIECPSRLVEQTVGIRDRESTFPGHPHHHWIVDSLLGCLMLYSKTDSGLNEGMESDRESLLPLRFTERRVGGESGDLNVYHHWERTVDYEIVRGLKCREVAREFARSQNIRASDWPKDSCLRFLRRMRSRLGTRTSSKNGSWWSEIVDASRPYSAIDLP